MCLFSSILFANEKEISMDKYKEFINKDINSFKSYLKRLDNSNDLVKNLDYLLDSIKKASSINELDFISLYYLDFKYSVESEIAYLVNKKS